MKVIDVHRIAMPALRAGVQIQRYDKVYYKGLECFVFGRRSTGYFDLRKLTGEKVHASAKANLLKLKESFRTLLIVRMPNFDAAASILAGGHPFSSPS